jgi:hypothetical protein
MKKDENRKSKIITVKIGEDKKSRIPRVLDTIYRMVKTPVSDEDNPDDDQTLFQRTLQTVEVEGVTVVDGGRAVNVNGDFEISLEDEDDEERFSDKKIWANKEEALFVWEHNTEIELKEAKKRLDKYTHAFNFLQTNLDEKQY